MRITFKAYDKLAKLDELTTSKFQRNQHPKEQIERLAKIMKARGVRHPIHISTRSDNICFGHGRKAAALLNGWIDYPIVYQDFESDDEEYACVQSDNAIAMWAELDLAGINSDIGDLGPDFDIDLLGMKDFVIDLSESNSSAESDASKTIDVSKIESPIYKPNREKPAVPDLFDLTKTESLIKNIREADIPEDIRTFLIAAAQRHTVFNYEKIADFYAHSQPQVQDLMEQSALVIIDFKSAMEAGLVLMTKRIVGAYEADWGDTDA